MRFGEEMEVHTIKFAACAGHASEAAVFVTSVTESGELGGAYGRPLARESFVSVKAKSVWQIRAVRPWRGVDARDAEH